MAGLMHYSNFFRFMETAEHAFFRSLGFSVIMKELPQPPIGWPRVHAECDYKRPLRFEDEVEVRLAVKEKRSKTISYQFRFRKVGETEDAARGLVTVVCVTWGPQPVRISPPAPSPASSPKRSPWPQPSLLL